MSRPISGKHAIEVANFVCVFERPFSVRSVQSLMTLKETFKERYPVFNTTNLFNVQLKEGELMQPSPSRTVGVNLQRLKKDSSLPAWAIRSELSAVVVSCYVYERWAKVAETAISDLIAVIRLADDGRNPVTQLVLHVVDRFVGGTRDTYNINQVFNSRSRYLPKQAIESGALWHVHQGWFENVPDSDNRLLQNLNLSTNETPQGVLTTIDHSIRYNFTQLSAVADVSNSETTLAIFEDLHAKNKTVVIDLLNKKQCKAIKLCR